MVAKLSLEKIDKKLEGTGLKLVGEYKGLEVLTEFKCFCGKIFIKWPCYIFNGGTKSCGCLPYPLFLSQEEVALRYTNVSRT